MLYIPSALRWTEAGAALELTQESDYPYEEQVAFALKASRPTELTLHFRIPAWAQGAEIALNGKRQPGLAIPGQFAEIRRTWQSGDRVDLHLPLRMRLEPIDAHHPETVALVRGPLALMAVKPRQQSPLPGVTRSQLLAARRVSERAWQVDSADGPVTMLAFPWLGDQPYSAYLRAT